MTFIARQNPRQGMRNRSWVMDTGERIQLGKRRRARVSLMLSWFIARVRQRWPAHQTMD